jgi:hypothetical protein
MGAAAMTDSPNSPMQRATALGAVLFEMNWPSFTWIREVRVREADSTATIAFVCTGEVAQTERDACTTMALGFIDLIFDPHAWKYQIEYVPEGKIAGLAGYRVAIDTNIFKKIARDVAPWRLELGR